jgi:hypothetical protein
MLVQPDGRFDFANVPPGTYRLSVSYADGGRGAAVPTGEALRFLGGSASIAPAGGRGRGAVELNEPLWADVQVVVAERDVTDLVLALQPGTRVSGRLSWEGKQPLGSSGAPQLTIGLVDVDGPRGRQVGTTRSDATFTFTTPPGNYGLQLLAGSTSHRIKSVSIGATDVTDLPLNVGTREIADVLITLTDEPQTVLTARVFDVGTPRVPDGLIAVFPADRKFWQLPLASASRFRSVSLTPKGTATINGLPPGEYFVAFDQEFDRLSWPSAPRLEVLARRAMRVTLAPGAPQSIEVRR